MKLDKRKIDLYRARKCMTTEELAETAKVSQTTIRKGYKEKISVNTVGKIAKALGVDVKEIIVEEDRPGKRGQKHVYRHCYYWSR